MAEGQWLAVHGCGGVGLSAIMIGRALGARVIAVDIDHAKLEFARNAGAEVSFHARETEDVIPAIREISDGGVHVSVDALGSPETCFNSVSGLRKRGKHVQVGLLSPEESNAPVPSGLIVANELEILGSHGIQAHRYPAILEMITEGVLKPEKLISRTVSLEEAASELVRMDQFSGSGISVITDFS